MTSHQVELMSVYKRRHQHLEAWVGVARSEASGSAPTVYSERAARMARLTAHSAWPTPAAFAQQVHALDALIQTVCQTITADPRWQQLDRVCLAAPPGVYGPDDISARMLVRRRTAAHSERRMLETPLREAVLERERFLEATHTGKVPRDLDHELEDQPITYIATPRACGYQHVRFATSEEEPVLVEREYAVEALSSPKRLGEGDIILTRAAPNLVPGDIIVYTERDGIMCLEVREQRQLERLERGTSDAFPHLASARGRETSSPGHDR